jgi:transcriptional antiterminator RfaH
MFEAGGGAGMKEWFVAHTQPNKEQLAQQHLLSQDYEVYLPLYKRLRKHARKVDTVLVPLFPGYIFVALDLLRDQWRQINGTRGVTHLITQDGIPIALPVDVVAALRSQETEGLVSLSSLSLFDQGQEIQVKEGFFSGYTGVFEKMDDKQRVNLLLTFLGQQQRICVSLYAVEAA